MVFTNCSVGLRTWKISHRGGFIWSNLWYWERKGFTALQGPPWPKGYEGLIPHCTGTLLDSGKQVFSSCSVAAKKMMKKPTSELQLGSLLLVPPEAKGTRSVRKPGWPQYSHCRGSLAQYSSVISLRVWWPSLSLFQSIIYLKLIFTCGIWV